MKFTREGYKSKRCCDFGDIDLGGIFFKSGNAYMVVNCDDISGDRYGECPAVNLGTGIIEFFNDNEPIVILDKELEITYKAEDLKEWADE
jgi:hypothetical protein